MASRFLVTGGAGYVGSHMVELLVGRGAELVVLDDLRQGHRASVPHGVLLVQADVGDAVALDSLMAHGGFDTVIHFAALSLVGESMQQPLRYFRENSANAFTLIDACVRHGVNRFVLSSTAALFGDAKGKLIDETAALDPASPYGESKLMIERALRWAGVAHGLRSACLRYFNAAGADPNGRIGEDHDPETHLVPLVIDAALGRRDAVVVFGEDYDTPDGTCIRDYIHVMDLAEAHLRALARLDHGNVTYNLGNGRGYSVRQVIDAVEAVSGLKVPVIQGERRPGDPAILVADSKRIREEAGWTPRYGELHDIVRTAFTWRRAHPLGYDDR